MNLVTEELLKLAAQHDGVLEPQVVVAAAKSESSPLHRCFLWDDTEAAGRYRLWQARQLISVTVQFIPASKETQRVFVSLRSQRSKGGGYETTVSVMSDEEKRNELLNDAHADMNTFRKKYAGLRQLAKVFAAMDEVE